MMIMRQDKTLMKDLQLLKKKKMKKGRFMIPLGHLKHCLKVNLKLK